MPSLSTKTEWHPILSVRNAENFLLLREFKITFGILCMFGQWDKEKQQKYVVFFY